MGKLTGHQTLYEPLYDKTNKMTLSSEDSDQPGHPPSLIRVFAVPQGVAQHPRCLHADSEDSNQIEQIPGMI